MNPTERIDKHRLLDRFATGNALRGPVMRALVEGAGAGALLEPGDRIGPWTIVELLGSGGMAHVYLARRSDGEFDQEVALKVVRRNADLINRLRHERQLIASMRHPHIVNLVDGGETEAGDLWLAMSLVDGVPIDTHAEQQALDWRARLRLFDAVCAAVEYAHGRGLIHRDIKPANVLIDTQGHPRLLDFGIAFEQGGEQSPDHAMTPGFAAPEQLLGLPLTTATDVFQLGLLLRRVIVSESGAARMPPPVRADVDALIERATAIHPEDRHPTVAALRADLTAVLTRRPLAHQAGLRRIRWSRYMERNRLPLAVAGVAALALTISLTLAALQLRNERDLARTNEARAQAIAKFLVETLSTANPWGKDAGGGTVLAAMDRAAERLDDELAQSLDVRGELRRAIVGVYTTMDEAESCLKLLSSPAAEAEQTAATPLHRATLQIMHSECHLMVDQRERAWAMLDAAERSLDGASGQEADALRAWLLTDRGQLRSLDGKLAESNQLLEQARAQAQRSGAREHEYRSMRMLGFNLIVADDTKGAAGYLRQALALSTEVHGPTHRSTLTTAGGLAMVLDRLGQSAEAETLLRQSIDTATRVRVRDDEPQIVVAELRDSLATLFFQQGRLDECVAEARTALTINQREAPETTRAFGSAWRAASCAYMLGQLDATADYARLALEVAQRGVPVGVVNSERMLAAVAARRGEFDQAEAHLQRAETALASAEVPNPNVKTSLLLTHALLAAKRGNAADAKTHLAAAGERMRTGTPPRFLTQEYAEISAMVAALSP